MKMHGNSEMQKINQTSAMPEKTDVHWSGRFSVAPMLDRMYRFLKTTSYTLCGSLLGTCYS
ncbi:tRNA-dihydrouridine synthase [Escherichia coli]|nr:tRNA-dihydrouridine synthase [Escherichia coli]